ncbi:MAG: histidinol dehydrogenase [Thermoleophilaceae bacterium]|nr:histidinol dehydrogenase [Thermoleophilaceae bacterium]
MAVKRFTSEAKASDIRALSPEQPVAAVEAILAAVKERGDAALLEYETKFGDAPDGGKIRVAQDVIDAAPGAIDIDLLGALKLAIGNVREVASAQLSDKESVTLTQGHRVSYRTIPLNRAAAYVPGGRGSYPSTAVMCLTTAVAAGVGSVCVLSPAREHGGVDTAVLAVCSLLGVDEVYAVGGAQAIAAAAYGTETIPAVDVIVGPGNSYVQEAKRQLVGRVGIDSVAGPSELVVVADAFADPALIALDLQAQGEHGPDSLVALISDDDALLDAVGRECAEIDAELALVKVDDLHQAVSLADEIAPEHLQLMVKDGVADELAVGIRNAGALFLGSNAATAFGDYVTGSNHVLPTGGAARYAGALSVATFRRRMAEVKVSDKAVGPLADAGATIARAEGFIWHAKSMEARKRD